MRRTIRSALIVALLVTGLMGTTANAQPVTAAPAAAPVPAMAMPMGTTFGTGNYYYTTINGFVLQGNVRFSWTHMWYIKNHMDSNTAISSAICGALPVSVNVKSACIAYVLAVAQVMKNKVNAAITHKKCLTVRWGLPPAFPLNGAAIWEVTCTI